MKLLIKMTFRSTIVSLAAVILVGCENERSRSPSCADQLEQALSALNLVNPEEDARLRFSENDFRFAGCWGEPGGPYFPGVERTEWERIYREEQFWTIDGTSDAIESRRHAKLIDRAAEYAERYNRRMGRLQSEGGLSNTNTNTIATDQADRIVHVTDLTSGAAIDQALAHLKRLDAADPGVPIVLEINSDGGLVYDSLEFAAAVRGLGAPVHTHTTKGAHAIAAVLIAAGTPGHRSADAGAVFSFLELQFDSPRPGHMEIKVRAAILESLTEIFGAEGATIDALLDSNRTYTASEAVEIGLIDQIASQANETE